MNLAPKSREDILKANRYMKRCSASLAIREMQITTIMSHHLALVRMAVINKTSNNKCWRCFGGEKKLLYILLVEM